MWVIYRDPKTPYTHLDKNVLCLVEDQHILAYQTTLARIVNQDITPLVDDATYLQPFVGIAYYARRYEPTTPHTAMTVPREPPLLETPKASLFRDVELPSPCSNGQ